jgi:hypothetical protein
MAMGMSPGEFWQGDPYLCRDYRLAFSLKREENDYLAWLNGAYFHNAVSAAIYNALRGSNSEPISYIEKPISASEKEKYKLTSEQEDELELAKAKIWMWNYFNGLCD